MDKAVFTQEVASCERSLYRISRTLLKSPADCADAVQEALLKAWQHRDRVDEAHFRAYLTRIVINECRSIGRRRARVTPVEAVPECAAPQSETTDMEEPTAFPSPIPYYQTTYARLDITKLRALLAEQGLSKPEGERWMNGRDDINRHNYAFYEEDHMRYQLYAYP